VKHRAASKPLSLAAVLIVLTIVAGSAMATYSALVIRDLPPTQASAVIPPQVQPITTEKKQTELEPRLLYESYPELNEKVGTITLESLELSWPIYQGTEETQLSRGVGHYVGSVFPGMLDNSILSGHRSTVFGRLGELKIDDLIHIQTKAGFFTYQVSAFRVVDLSDTTVIMPTPTAVLTLTTCYPFDNWGASTEAFIVTADLVSSVLNQP